MSAISRRTLLRGAAGIGAMTALAACGAGGGTCVTCDPATADSCSPTGVCACGSGPACTAPDTCVGGVCLGCGPTTCPDGCCANNRCQPGTGRAQCGKGGIACLKCQPNNCVAQTCQ